jgi:hypothetical protein
MNQLDFIFHGPIKHEEFNWSIQLVQNKNEYYRMNTINPNVYYFFYNSFDNLYNKDKKEEHIVSEERASNFKRLLGGGIINNNIYPDWNTTIYHTQSLNVVTIRKADTIITTGAIYNNKGNLEDTVCRKRNSMVVNNLTLTCTCSTFSFNGIYCYEILATLHILKYIDIVSNSAPLPSVGKRKSYPECFTQEKRTKPTQYNKRFVMDANNNLGEVKHYDNYKKKWFVYYFNINIRNEVDEDELLILFESYDKFKASMDEKYANEFFSNN